MKDGSDVSKIYCKIQDHTMKIFFKIVISNIVRLRPTNPPHPLTLTAYPTPGNVVPNFFFHQNDRKGRKRDYLDALGLFL